MNLASHIRTIDGFPKPGIVFRDALPILRDPDATAAVACAIAREWDGKADAVAGLEARGFLFGTLVAAKLGLPFVPIRKKGKLPGETLSVAYDLEYGSDHIEVQADAFSPGARVVVVDDLLATGGTAAAACALIAKAGAQAAGCAFVVELSELGGRMKLPVSVQSLVVY